MIKYAVKFITAITVSVGPPKSTETLRTALALGADSAIHVENAESSLSPDPLSVARILKGYIEFKRCWTMLDVPRALSVKAGRN